MTQQKSTVPPLFAYEKDILKPIPSQPPSLEDDRKDTLIDWQLAREVQVLVVILLVGIILVVGFLNRQVENALLLALFLSGVIILGISAD